MPNKLKIAMNLAGITVSELARATGVRSTKLLQLLSGEGATLYDADKISAHLDVDPLDVFVLQGEFGFGRVKGGRIRIAGNKLIRAMAASNMTIDELSDASGITSSRLKKVLGFYVARPWEVEAIGMALSVDYNHVFVHRTDGFFVRERGGRF